MNRHLVYALAGIVTLTTWAASPTPSTAATPDPATDEAKWLRTLLPLPKQIAIKQVAELPVNNVKLTVAKGSGDVVKTAASELQALVTEQGGQATDGAGQFEILLGVCDSSGRLEGLTVPGAAQLADLPNAEQAYVIRPLDNTRLVLTALDQRGVYYAAQTLRQLLESSLHQGRVKIPLATITDWPDLAERGLWGGSANRDIVWMAQHKMNLVESHVTLGISEDGHGRATADAELIDLAHRHALKFVPVITHLNGLGRTGIYNTYPELRGQGDKAVHPTHTNLVAPCCSHPKLTQILADWMIDLGNQKGVTDVCAWLSELSNQYCDCEQCRKAGVGQYALETRCLVTAYRLAQKKHPDLGLRILLTQGSYTSNDKVLAEVPSDVDVTYYDGGRTYDSSRDPMIYPLLEDYAARGNWLGCYPQLTASWRICCPWSGPQFIRTRMNEFVDKKLQCLCGYATPDNRLYEFNVLAAAEWSWNARGRDERQFATAWATRKGINDPNAAAEWAVTLGPVGWDVYGSRVPFSSFFGRAKILVAKRRKPKLGDGMFRYFPTEREYRRRSGRLPESHGHRQTSRRTTPHRRNASAPRLPDYDPPNLHHRRESLCIETAHIRGAGRNPESSWKPGLGQHENHRGTREMGATLRQRRKPSYRRLTTARHDRRHRTDHRRHRPLPCQPGNPRSHRTVPPTGNRPVENGRLRRRRPHHQDIRRHRFPHGPR